jgi:uncharacterized membrane protein
MKNKTNAGAIVAIAAFLIYAAFTLLLGLNIASKILGPIVILLIPGYLFLHALWTRENKFSFLETVVFSFCVSIFFVGVTGFLLDIFWIVTFESMLIIIGALSIALFAVVLIKKPNLDFRPFLYVAEKLWNNFKGLRGTQAILTIAIIVSIFAAIPLSFYLVSTMPSEQYTAFGLLNENGNPSIVKYAKVNDSFSISCMIRNEEGREVNYTLLVKAVFVSGLNETLYETTIIQGVGREYYHLNISSSNMGICDIVFTLQADGVKPHTLILKDVEIYE